MDKVIDALINIESLQGVIDMHMTALETLKSETTRLDNEWSHVDLQKQKIESQLIVLMSYRSFLQREGFNKLAMGFK